MNNNRPAVCQVREPRSPSPIDHRHRSGSSRWDSGGPGEKAVAGAKGNFTPLLRHALTGMGGETRFYARIPFFRTSCPRNPYRAADKIIGPRRPRAASTASSCPQDINRRARKAGKISSIYESRWKSPSLSRHAALPRSPARGHRGAGDRSLIFHSTIDWHPHPPPTIFHSCFLSGVNAPQSTRCASGNLFLSFSHRSHIEEFPKRFAVGAPRRGRSRAGPRGTQSCPCDRSCARRTQSCRFFLPGQNELPAGGMLRSPAARWLLESQN